MEIAAAIIAILFAIYLIVNNMKLKSEYQRTEKIKNTLIDVAKEIEDFKSIDDLYQRILEYTIDLIENAQRGSILIYDRNKNHMEYKAAVGFDIESLKNVHLRKEELYLYRTTKLKEPSIIKNPRVFDDEHLSKKSFKKLVESNALDIKCTISAPIYIDGDFYGVINLDNNIREDAFNKRDIILLKYIVIQLEAAIKIVKLMNELKFISSYDHLTGLLNRRKFEELLNDLLSTGETLSICLIDLDDFKYINDTFGHKKGDEALKHFTNAIRKQFDDNAYICRYAGDEFVIVFKGSKKILREKIDEIKEFLDTNPVDGINVKFSAGYSSTFETRNADKLITIADNEMYEQKKKNKLEVR
ncbi:putative diguanylate cyclase YeaP [Caloramator mitchellensis]|uniref:Putative diguanylate cyclase YeaP n=1 Tax=Caloramator mitchellensis TaxID=908809 RepID=A0A0R3JZK1_CALMK|nr:sensor domain-containing diguanylate cyclase [Caloramator mitchellensis]KRQ87709.1 putative diguanylate cyclase YeaP [Caloramator mitchellensis]